ncbi:hypothetical protein [Synechocystis sp. PCC 6714]|uniref:hypothetical protein n=2 Tax=unclassified Synechocystis TaxID=2640012 RepID=UPI000490E810|nr:hypothetical protein [Synechocystis sp. PCC 6714]
MQSLKHEVRKVGSLSLFFFIGYGYILILMKLLLKEFSVDVNIFAKVVIYSIISAKSVAIMDMTPWMNRFSEYPRYLQVLYKTSIYTLAVFLLNLIENIFHAYHQTKALNSAFMLFLETRSFSRFLAILLCVSIIFLIHNIFQEFDRYLGKDNLSKFFLKPPQ